MTSENYHFKIGAFDCTIVSDGAFAYPHPGQLLFANAPQIPIAWPGLYHSNWTGLAVAAA